MLSELIYRAKRPYHWFKTGLANGLPSALKYRLPQRKLKILAITGTDGKTTSTTLLYHVLKNSGRKVGLVSTVAAFIGDEAIDTGFHVTAPQPSQLFKFMRQMVNEGYEYLVLEATSHGIYQHRTWGIKPFVAGVTNINYEHLDYHLNYDNYVAAKALLLKKAKFAVINGNDLSSSRLRKALKYKKHNLLEFAIEDRLPRVIQQAANARFTETYNQANVRLVTQMARVVGLTDQEIAQGVLSFTDIPGRMERIPNKRGLEIVVDFAHTPQGLEAALKTLKKEVKGSGRLIAIFGCASERDRQKRPVMTRIASELADFAILTAEDPRHEDIWAILREMKDGLVNKHDRVLSIAERGQAISFALNTLAKPGDIIGIFGKGHEKSMNIGGIELPWSDQDVVKEMLKRKR